MGPTADRRTQVFLEISSTDWCVCGAPSCLNMRSPTKAHSLHYEQFMVSRSTHACQLNRVVWRSLASSKDFARSNSYLEIFSNFRAV